MPPSRIDQVISIVDDDVSVRAATDNLLRSLGYTVHTFVSAEEFVRSAHLNDTSCVIADVQMPGMSGVDLGCSPRGIVCRSFSSRRSPMRLSVRER
jgi:FixJ family two-component response regulator